MNFDYGNRITKSIFVRRGQKFFEEFIDLPRIKKRGDAKHHRAPVRRDGMKNNVGKIKVAGNKHGVFFKSVGKNILISRARKTDISNMQNFI